MKKNNLFQNTLMTWKY